MATALTRKLFPGCWLRTNKTGRTIRFDAMVKGNRFVGRSKLPESLAIDPKGRPTAELRTEYMKWRIEQEVERIGPENVGLRQPTIRELIETYQKIAWERHNNPAHRNPSVRTIETAVKNFRYCVEASGLADTRPFSELTDVNVMRRIFKTFCSRIGKSGRPISPISAWSYLQSIQSVTAAWTIPMYYDNALDVKRPNIEAVDVGNAKKAPKYHSLTPEQKRKIMLWYSSLEEKLGPEYRIAALLSLKLGMRPCDAIHASVETFPVKNGKRHLAYEPQKTFNRSGRAVDIAIAPAIWEEIASLAGDDLVTGAVFIKSPRTVYDKLNASMRYACDMKPEDGWDKGVYELRKMCYDEIWHDPKLGPDVAVALSGENRSTLESYYADPYSTKAVIGA